MHPLLFDIIRMSNDLSCKGHAYLLEDGLDLWLTTVRYSPHCSDEMLQLLANLPQLLGNTEKILKNMLPILEEPRNI